MSPLYCFSYCCEKVKLLRVLMLQSSQLSFRSTFSFLPWTLQVGFRTKIYTLSSWSFDIKQHYQSPSKKESSKSLLAMFWDHYQKSIQTCQWAVHWSTAQQPNNDRQSGPCTLHPNVKLIRSLRYNCSCLSSLHELKIQLHCQTVLWRKKNKNVFKLAISP